MQNKTSWLLIFTFSPVQGFISSAKKTKDLFAGSYLLSFLTKVVLTKLENQLGEDLIKVYPQVEENSSDLYSLMVGNYPNRFVVVLKDKSPQEVRELIKTAKGYFHNELFKLAGNTCHLFVERALENAEKCPSKLDNLPYLKGAVEQLMNHIGDYFSCFIVAKPVKLCKKGEIYEIENYQREYEITEKLLGGRKTFRPYEGKVDNATYDGEKYPDGCTTCGERLHLAIDWQKARIEDIAEEEKLCGLCYAKRNLYEVYLKEKLQKGEDEELELLMTRFPSTHDIALAKEKYEFFLQLVEKDIETNEELKQFLQKLTEVMFKFADEGSISYGINTLWRKELKEKIPQNWSEYLDNIIASLNLKKEKKDRYEKILRHPWMVSVEFLSTSHIETLLRKLKDKTKNGTKKYEEKIQTLQK